jgi:galactokinase
VLANLTDRLDLAWELRLVSYAYREEFGSPPAGIWHAPGSVTLLADGPLRLTVATRWGAIAAAGPRPDGVIELIRMNRPDERLRLTVREAAAGAGPAWAGAGLRSARGGASLLVSTDLPEGSGVGAATATQAAIGLALRGLAQPGEPQDAAAQTNGSEAGPALLGDRRLPFDIAAAGLRLMVIDTRVRSFPQPPIAEHAPVEAAAAALAAGAFGKLGWMLTVAHAAQARADVQEIAVSAALSAGALGARLLADGPGRPVCALLPAGRLAAVRREVAGAFAHRRLRHPRFLTVSAGPGPLGSAPASGCAPR